MSLADDLEKLAQLQTSGVLTADEFAQAKARLLAADSPLHVSTPASPPRLGVASLSSANKNGRRLPALLVDIAAIWAVLWALSLAVPISDTTNIAVGVIYLICRDALISGGSLGKRICGLTLIDRRSGQLLSRSAAIVRQFCCYFGMTVAGAITTALGAMIWGKPSDPFHHASWGVAMFMLNQARGEYTFCDRAANAALVFRVFSVFAVVPPGSAWMEV